MQSKISRFRESQFLGLYIGLFFVSALFVIISLTVPKSELAYEAWVNREIKLILSRG